MVKKTARKRQPAFVKGNKLGKKFEKGNKAAVGHGRPPKLPDMIEAIARAIGVEVPSGKYKGLTAWDVIMQRMQRMARAGNVKAAQFLADRGYGKAKQYIEVDTVPRKDASEIFPKK